jgi:type II secretory pathway pseudopilin PulG
LVASDLHLQTGTKKLQQGRVSKRGFTLLETLIAFGVMALIVGGLAGLFAWATTQQNLRLNRLLLAESATSVLEEYAASYPVMAKSGTEAGGWSWAVVEETTVPDQVVALRDQITYLRLTARVWREAEPDLVITSSSLLAIRASP